MTSSGVVQSSVFNNLIHEIETAETKLSDLINTLTSKKQPRCEKGVLEEEITLLKKSVPGGLDGGDGESGLHYYTGTNSKADFSETHCICMFEAISI